MSNLAITPQWHDEINQVETNEVIMGGAKGNANLATKQLAESLLWLKQQFETKKTETYKVGDIYMTTINHADAAAVKAHHGYGTWVRYAEGRAPVGFSDNASDIAEYKTMGNTFGENTHKLTIAEMPSHAHDVGEHYGGNLALSSLAGTSNSDERRGINTNIKSEMLNPTGETGSDKPHNNIQPSIVTGYWLRTA